MYHTALKAVIGPHLACFFCFNVLLDDSLEAAKQGPDSCCVPWNIPSQRTTMNDTQLQSLACHACKH